MEANKRTGGFITLKLKWVSLTKDLGFSFGTDFGVIFGSTSILYELGESPKRLALISSKEIQKRSF